MGDILKARLLDMGTVSCLRSQSIYHAVTDCMQPDGEVTISLMRPNAPYVSIGYFQEAEQEVDLAYCADHRMPVIRRHVGGGAVLLDGNQLFFHVILPQAKAQALGLPATLGERFAFLARPPIAAYQRLGVPANFRPINDIHVNGRKIGGTGVGEIGAGLVFAGSMMLDFDTRLMARVLKLPDEKMRDKVNQSLNDYMTTLTKEKGAAPPLAEVADALVNAFEETFGLDLIPSLPTAEEMEAVYRWDETLSSPEWFNQVRLKEQPTRSVKISSSVRVLQGAHKAPGGMIRVTLRVVDDVIDDVLISGDFPVSPQAALADVTGAFTGLKFSPAAIEGAVRQVFGRGGFDMAGVGEADFQTVFQRVVA